MKMMKKTLGAFAFIAALCFSLTTSAQFGGGPPQGGGGGGMRPDFEGRTPEPPDPEKMVEQEVKWMKKKLKLNPDQIDRVTDISTKYALTQTDFMQKQMRSRARNSSEDGRPSEKDMQKNREIMEKLMKDKDHEMSEVLTAAQYEKYLKRREDVRKSSQQNQQSRGGFDSPSGGGGGFQRGGGSF